MQRGFLSFLLLFLLQSLSFGQRNITHQPQYWLHYTALLNFPSKTTIFLDAQSRRFFKEKGYAAAFLRSQVQVPLNGNVFFDAAAACFYFYGQNYSKAELETHPSYLDIRIHQSLLVRQTTGKFSITNRLRLEERFVQQQRASGSNEFELLPRLRLALLVNYSLAEKWELRAFNDVVFNVFQKKAPNVFERNLFGVGIFRQLSKRTGLEVGYLSQFISRQIQGEYVERSNLRINMIHSFSLKNRPEQGNF